MTGQFDHIGAALNATETTETYLGDIEVPIGASRITGICLQVTQTTGTATQGFVGFGRLSGLGLGELDGIPANLVSPINAGQCVYQPEFVKVDILIAAKTKIRCFATLTVAQTGTGRGQMALRFE